MPDRSLRVRHILYAGQLIAYLLILAVAVWSFGVQRQITDRLCQGAAENRRALREVVEGVGTLGRDLILDGQQHPTREQRAAMRRVTSFQTSQLDTLELPICS